MAKVPLPRGVIILLAASFAGLAAIIVIDLLVPPSPEDHLGALRSRLARLRLENDSCRAALEREEDELRRTDQRLDSLRGRIDSFEVLDSRGVPADSYDAYLRAFNSFNAGVPDRALAAETLQAHWRACARLAEVHNQTVDSARTIATELGLVSDSSAERSAR